MTRFTSLAVALAAGIVAAGCGSTAGATRSSADVAASAGGAVEYTVSIPDLAVEKFRVEGTLHGMADDTLVVHFPVWAPGAYDIVDFGAYVSDFQARDAAGGALTVLRGDTNTFRIVGATAETRISYSVDDIEWLSNSAWFGLSDIQPELAFANATALFAYPAGRKEIPFRVTYVPPKDWTVAVSLDPAPGGGNRYTAASYDELVDAPVQMGHFQRFDFTFKGIEHVITVTAPERLDDTTGARLVATTRRIVEAMTGLFGELPYPRYYFHHFLVDVRSRTARGSFGALEHANASAYLMPYYGQENVSASLASVIAHEFWHLWSPKRIHVHELGPFDYQKGPETASLWFAEGLTEYYARVINTRIGVGSPGGFLREFQSDLIGLLDRPQVEPMTDLSRRIIHAPTSELIDLYRRGPLLGYLLGTEIRWQTKNARSLDDAMRYFNDEYAKKGRTFGDEEIMPIIERATGATLGDFYRRYVAGRDTLPFREAFRRSGLLFTVRDTVRPAIGAVLEKTREGVRIERVLPGGSAEAMGLRAGDVMTTFDADGYAIPIRSFPLEFLQDVFTTTEDEPDSTGAPVYSLKSVSITRDGQTLKIPAKVLPSPSTIERLEADPAASGLALEIRRSMLGF